MRLIKLLSLLLLLVPARALAQEPDTARWGVRLSAEELMTDAPPPLRLGLSPLPSAFRLPIPAWSAVADALRWGLPGSGVPPSMAGLPPLPGDTVGLPADVAALPGDTALPDVAPLPGDTMLPDVAALPGDTVLPEEGAVPGDTTGGGGVFPDLELPDVVQQIADLGLRVEGRGELAGVWNRYRPCEPGLRLNCNTGLFPQLQPEIQFGVQVDGTITDRIHVDVDYDQRREFDAANNINVYYQGEAGELVQRLEMGDVSIDLPASRYLAQGIPAGNFGFKAQTRMGPLDVEAVWAQQKGDIATREFRLGGAGQAGLVQDQELILDDGDYAAGQFFFLLDPSRLAGWPHVDVMTLDPADAPFDARPLADRLVLYRDEGLTAAQYADQAQVGKFLADAVSEDGVLRHSGLFELLQPGEDYFIHSSGLWVALRVPLRDDEALAVAYVTEAGDTVGDPAAEARPPGETPELRLVRGPVTIHQPGQPTWTWEMHQVYRLDSSADVEAETLELVISLGHAAGGATFKEFAGGQISLLRLFGLDDDAPADRIDVAHLFRPGAVLEALGPGAVRGTFIVFPTLEPFARPPPVPSEGLTAVETAAILGTDANPEIYEEVDPVIREGSSRFRLNFRYRVRLEGLLSSFNLGAFGIRQGSERITVDDRLLVRGIDYVIDYDLGLVTLLDPQATLGMNPDAEIRAQWEQRSLFRIAPTTVFGLNARAPIAEYGQLNFVGLYQAEQSIVRRPQLGLEPGAVVLGGATGELAFRADWVARALDAIPLLAVDSTARLDVSGELAFSSPEPNRRGATYVDDFEATDEIALGLDASDWELGSAPQDATGVPSLPPIIAPDNAAEIVWQDRYLQDGREIGFLTPEEIDEQIEFAGARLAERVLYLTMGGGLRPVTSPQWRSVTTVLSPNGRDLSRSEFLEFYAAPFRGPVTDVTLVIDIGTVSEDAYYVDETGALEGVTEFGQTWGRGVLDEEARLALREVWGPEDDRQGLWDQSCEADRLNPVPLGDPRANCTVLNGRPDTEDLNANGVLDDLDGPAFRYVVPLDRDSPYLVRDEDATGSELGFRLFRIPLRGPGAIPLYGANDGSWRFVKHLRMTVVKPRTGEGTVALARFRIAGSRWTKRNIDGVVQGLLGDAVGTGAATANVRVGPVSRLTDGPAYTSPPGVEDELQDPSSAVGATGVEFNEKSLRLSWEGLPADERAEVYFRYPQQPRSFLEYRRLRFWAAPRDGSWGPGGDHTLLVKLGTDPRNYYLYRTRLRPVGGSAVSQEDWLPEHILDFGEWFALKAEVEQRLAADGGGSLVVWNADSTYAVVLEDRARAPNLAGIRELTFAVYNGGMADSDGEVWINDLRLDRGVRETGVAGRIDLNLDAAGVVSAAVSFGGRGGQFRQLDGAPTFETVDELSVHTTTQLGRLAPEEWGLSMPVTVSYLHTSLDPIFLQGTDVQASHLPGLRETGSTRRRVGVSVRKTTPSPNPLVGALIDGTSVRLGYLSTSDATVTTASRLSGLDGGIEVDRSVGTVDVDVVPGFLETLLRWLAPGRVERSAFFQRLADTRLRLTPERIGVSASYTSQDARVWRYDRVLETPADLDVAPIESPRRTLEGGARIALRPLESLTARVGVVTGRDVLTPVRATRLPTEQEAIRRARGDLLGIPVGWERERVVTADGAFRPVIADWLRPSVAWTSRFGQRQDPSHLAVVQTEGGEAAELLRTFNADRRLGRGVIFDLPAAFRAAALPPGAVGETGADAEEGGGGQEAEPGEAEEVEPGEAQEAAGPGGLAGLVLVALRPLKPVELSWTDEVGSRFDRDLATPGLAFQLGIGTVNDFRYLGEDTAATALRRDAFRARSGIRLSANASLDVGYAESDARTYDLRAGRRARLERAWPDVQLSWRDVPVPFWAAPFLDSWSMSTGYIQTERATRLTGLTTRVLSQFEHTVPLELRLGFRGGLSLAYIGSFTVGDGEDPTGFTEQNALTHAVDLSGRFRPPGALGRRFAEPIRLSLTYDYQEQQQSRLAAALEGREDPTPFIDHINRRVNLNVSTLVSRMDIGLQVSYLDRRNFIGAQIGSSQFQLGLFGQFDMQAGTGDR